MSTGYIGCFKDSKERVLNGDRQDFDPNSSKRCKQYCSNKGYRYAGTQSGQECFCGHNIRYKSHSDDCDYECEGYSAEICGGDWKISIYDTWHCAAQPCKNDSTCNDIDANTYNCSCTNGWTGKNCEQEIPLPSTSTTTATTMTNETTPLKTQSPVYINATESNQLFESTTTTTNTSDIQYINSTGDSNNSMIALYVLLPLCVCFVVVIVAVVLKRRRRQQRDDDTHHVYSEPTEHGMTSTYQDNKTGARSSSAGKLRHQPATFNRSSNDSYEMPSSDEYFEILQHKQASDSEYTTIDHQNTSSDNSRSADENYELLNKCKTPEGEYSTLYI